MKRMLIIGGVIVLTALGMLGFLYRDQIVARYFSPTQSNIDEAANQPTTEVFAENLETPWSISFLPSGDMIVTERSGRLTRIGENGKSITIQGVRETSEGGLLGMALDPKFESNQFIYLYYTTDESGELTNRIDRYKLLNDSLTEQQTVISDIPAASNHNGGAIAFGPDEKLYITTGDAAKPELAQDRDSLAGKILRLNSDGTVPDDNPFNNLVWSLGHRNPQGIAWDDKGRLWSVEHGPSGSSSGEDELNLIIRGANYGWPTFTGDRTAPGFIAPIVQSGENDTWAPAGMAHSGGVLYFAGLRGQTLYRAATNDAGDSVKLERLFSGSFGRLRAVTAHEGSIYFSTSNRDGRGSPRSGDDKIYRMRTSE